MKSRIVVAAEELTALVSNIAKLPERKELSEETHRQLLAAVQATVDEVAEGEQVSFLTIYTKGKEG